MEKVAFTVPKVLSDDEMKRHMGDFFDATYYNFFVDQSADIYTENGTLLFSLQKNVIPNYLTEKGVLSFKEAARKSRTNSRGIASGKVDLTRINGNVVGVTSPGKYKTNVIFDDGTISNYKVANTVPSMIAGYYDKPNRKAYNRSNIPCRKTAFTRDQVVKWEEALPLIQYVDYLYEYTYPNKYYEQRALADKIPEYAIDDTSFTTITVNHNWRTAAHIDSGDLHDGYSALIVCEEGDWSGCYIGYPQYGICANLREGDFCLMNPHEWHANTELYLHSEDACRISIVMYFREGMLKCADQL